MKIYFQAVQLNSSRGVEKMTSLIKINGINLGKVISAWGKWHEYDGESEGNGYEEKLVL